MGHTKQSNIYSFQYSNIKPYEIREADSVTKKSVYERKVNDQDYEQLRA